jgi:hypothetical protein
MSIAGDQHAIIDAEAHSEAHFDATTTPAKRKRALLSACASKRPPFIEKGAGR